MATDEQLAAHVRQRIEAWLDEDPDRTATLLAREAGVTPTTISEIRSGDRGVGMKTLRGLARAWNTTASRIEEEANATPAPKKPRPQERTVDYEPRPDSARATMANWDESERLARIRYEREEIPDEAWVNARELAGFDFPEKATPEYVRDLALLWLRYSKPRK